MQSFRTLGQPLLRERLPDGGEREEEKNTTSDHYALPATPNGRTRTSLRPKIPSHVYVKTIRNQVKLLINVQPV